MTLLPPSARGVLSDGRVAQQVHANTDSATIFVWGQYPEIYRASGRELATRFIHTGFLTGTPAADL